MSTQGLVGIDVEQTTGRRDIAAIAEASFGASEREEVARNGCDAFYRIWTLREATAKALGHGLPMVVDRRDRVATTPATGVWSWTMDGGGWLLMHDKPTDGVYLSLAAAISNADSRIEIPIRVVPPGIRD